MAAYGALVSLMHIIEQIEHHPRPRPPICLDKTQVESLTSKITFLQEFLEGYSHVGYNNEADDLEMRIAGAAYAAEDVIESNIVDHIHAESMSHEDKIRCFNCFPDLQKVKSQDKKIRYVDLHNSLEKVIQDMDLIKKEVMERRGVQDLMHIKSTPTPSVRSSSTKQNITVGLDDVLIEVMDKLTCGQLGRLIIPIVGMGGSGKTTLAKIVYQNQVVVQHFDILVWVTISQEYRVREILLEMLSEEGAESERQKNECELGERLHKKLSGRRYLIIIDDIWDIEVWDQLNLYFPSNNSGSRIMLTTRLSNLAYEVANSNVIKMGLLDENNSWDLFCKIVFGEEACACELEEIGKKIIKNCKGLPLSIVVVGGLLAKTEHKREYWECIGANLSSAVNSENDESCLRILYMSYNELPVYLKPCFLYMGVFREDERIYVSTLVKLWVSEGFLKPKRGKSLEIVAKEYLKELIDRNLVLVHRLGSTGTIKFCKIHDLLRDLCLREAQKEMFYNVTRQHSPPQCIHSRPRIVVLDSISKTKVVALNTGSLVRSLIWDNDENQHDSLVPSLIWDSDEKLPSHDFRLLRILKAYERYSNHGSEYLGENTLKFVNSRYISIRAHLDFKFSSSVHLLWNLQTLIFHTMRSLTAPTEIWKMPQLKHIECAGGLFLPDPPRGCLRGQDDNVLTNLQKLMSVINFKCGKESVKRIPNIKNLRLRYQVFKEDSSYYCLNNLERLHKLESFHCAFNYGKPNDCLRKLTLPHSLKKLTLNPQLSQHWEDIMEKIGSLPLLEKLRLIDGSFHAHKWETVEGQFGSLKFLEISGCRKLECWKTDYSHFPRLEHLVLSQLRELIEIPSAVGEIPTLQSIEVICCSDGAVISAKEIATEQEELGNEGLGVKVLLDWKNEAVRSLEITPNFKLKL